MDKVFDRHPASFRDPSGYIFQCGDELFRRITPAGEADFAFFQSSGLAGNLLQKQQLVPFQIVPRTEDGMMIRLEKLPFISYPYEWSFTQLHDAALLTLELMQTALEHGMILKDASAFNLAFQNGHPVFLDHTSFTRYQPGEPWRAYRQYVMHFLAPLLLMKHVDLRCLALFREDIGGIPLDLASRMLPWYTRLNINTLIHLHLHATFDNRFSGRKKSSRKTTMSKSNLQNFIRALTGYTASLKIPRQSTQWADYYNDNSYSEQNFQFKKAAVEDFCKRCAPRAVLDLGANSGVFSEIAARYARMVIAADIDPQAVEQLYLLEKTRCPNLHAVLQDLNNPSPDLGVFNVERSAFLRRCPADLALGLALIHHLRISGNWTLEQIVHLFACAAPDALVEFVPADDVQVKRLMRGREAIYADWTLDQVLSAFRKRYRAVRTLPLPGCGRVLIELQERMGKI